MADRVALVPPLTLDESAPADLRAGERLAMTTCNECHGLDLRGETGRDYVTPDLAIIAGYSLDEFRVLMKDCRTQDGRYVAGLMGLVCPDRFYAFSDGEVASLHAFLSTLASTPPPERVPWRTKGL